MEKKHIIGLLALGTLTVTGIILYNRRPFIDIVPDWDKKSFKYKLSVAGESIEGEYKDGDKPIEENKGKYRFNVRGSNPVILSIWKTGKSHTLKSFVADFNTKSIYENQGVTVQEKK